MWRQVQGSGDWDGLLRPLHPVLRNEVARYGGLVGACYDALDMDRSSARYMRCKHRMDRMLDEAGGTAGAGYEVTKYIYAAPDVAVPVPPQPMGSWVGYVAVSTDEMTPRLGRRDVLVSFRGTVTPAEWTANLMSLLRSARLDARHPRPDVKVESGFLNLYTSAVAADGTGSCREQLLGEVSRLIASCPGDEDRVPVSVFSFGGPRFGNAAFKARCDALGVKALRVANVRDPITNVPGALLNERTRELLAGGACFVHVGVELALDFASLRDLGSVHDLGAYVTCLAQGSRSAGRDEQRHGARRRRRRLTTARRGGVPGAATVRSGDRLQLTALGFLLFLYGALHRWPLINPLLVTLFSNLNL
ncbi:Phospholipase A1 EG1, chloroplastic [Dichanthelium oligosanthes]|uniref:Phospholipase A1 EG1, chloroplastic n=1 Tax=Dichanthelium oligosanthes TaxID=888268 RepID=A0A1E5VZ36_9POAL|nr:Phospholipase A1 EG1, chloroplastic [Dichanthelium oligosanthes]